VHPKTGRICVPVDPEQIDEFDPELVPTVGQLLRELDATTSESTGEEPSSGPSSPLFFFFSCGPQAEIVLILAFTSQDWEKTSLKPYVEMLEKHALGLMNVVRKDRVANGGFRDCRNWLDADRLGNKI
jgi:DNA primase small subunit